MRLPVELTLDMGGAGGEIFPPPEAPQGAGPLTAAALALEHHVNWAPLSAALSRRLAMDADGSKEMAEEARERVRQVQGRVADGVEELRGYAESADRFVREFARERPVLALACAVGIGFLIGRLASRA